jgi:hypothetical protein
VIGCDVGTLQRGLAACALTLAASASAWACGFDDPNSVAVQRGMMNLAFPKSAWVRTAVWQAQVAGDLPRDALAQRDDLAPQARGMLQLMRATWLLKVLAARLDKAPDADDPPALAVVLMGPMLWSRIEPQRAGAQLRTHVSGPEAGDVVLVTDTPALEALVGAGMGFERALELGLVRLYGPEAKVGAVQAWLSATR